MRRLVGIRAGRRRGERGALTPAVAVMAVGFLLLGGLVTDGGRQLNAQLTAKAVAEEGARAGSTYVDTFEAKARLDEPASEEAVIVYCTQAREENPEITECRPDGFGFDANLDVDFIKVYVKIEVDALLFGLIGINSLDADATAQAYPVQAITDPNNDVLQPSVDPTVVYPSSGASEPHQTGPSATSNLPPTNYTTSVCGTQTALPLTVGLSCFTTTTQNPNPPPPRLTTTVFTPYPTTVTPIF